MWEREKSTWPNHELSRFVEAAGSRWHVQQMGSGAPLLLVHGTGASTHSWRDILPLLGKHYSVLAADLPGHGFTESAGTTRSSIEGMSAALSMLLGALRFNPLYCVGHSAGAVILCRMALDRRIDPRVIISLNGAFVPLGGPAGVLFSPLAKLLARSSLLPRLLARRAGNPASVARVLDGTGSKVDARGLELYTRLVNNPKHLQGALGMMGNWDLRTFARDLPRLTTPLALVAAENDRTVAPHQAFEIQQRLANASVCSLSGVGHLAHEEQPVLVSEKILSICRAHAGTP
ncbi:MAG TPA: alpha/beta fold hydrolase BchO [Steroidobacteraceae bacterium]